MDSLIHDAGEVFTDTGIIERCVRLMAYSFAVAVYQGELAVINRRLETESQKPHNADFMIWGLNLVMNEARKKQRVIMESILDHTKGGDFSDQP
jgi:hypothetical protein